MRATKKSMARTGGSSPAKEAKPYSKHTISGLTPPLFITKIIGAPGGIVKIFLFPFGWSRDLLFYP